jgi:hypothetical protein
MMPLYEAKMIHHYDTRWATYEDDGSTRLMTETEKAGRELPMPHYWVTEKEVDRKLGRAWQQNWLFGYRGICRATDERAVISSMLPRVGAGNSIIMMLPKSSQSRHLLTAAMSSFTFDFVARQKVGGTNLNFFLMQQFAVPLPGTVVSGLTLPKPFPSWIATAVDRLNAWSTTPETRAILRAELDALMFHLYGVARPDVGYIMETVPIAKRKDEDRHGEYRTKRLILAAYDAMAEAIVTGRTYRSPFAEVPA